MHLKMEHCVLIIYSEAAFACRLFMHGRQSLTNYSCEGNSSEVFHFEQILIVDVKKGYFDSHSMAALWCAPVLINMLTLLEGSCHGEGRSQL